jgi:ABC-type branched-subunit amino acid transport system ATPase component
MLSVQNISREFFGLRALDDVTFDVDQGSITALIGPNGAGKTTLVNVISAIVPPSAGMVRFEQEPITSSSPHRVARLGIRRTFQTVHLFGGMTVRDNLVVGRFSRAQEQQTWSILSLPRWGDAPGRARNDQVLALMELTAVADEIAIDLPYGMQRRVEIARALCAEPRLLLLDEPAAGMNQAETDQLRDDIGTIRDSGVTVLLIDHDMSLVMNLSDKVVVLDFGRKIAEGTPAEIRRDPIVAKSYLGSS